MKLYRLSSYDATCMRGAMSYLAEDETLHNLGNLNRFPIDLKI